MMKRRLIITSLLGVVVLLTISTSFSIAWYASSTNLFVNDLVIEVDDDREILISLNEDMGYKSDLKEGEDELNEVGLYKPVSSMMSNKWIDLKKDLPEFRDVSILDTEGDTTISWLNGFYSQELYLKSDDDLWVTIDPKNTTFAADHAKNLIEAQKSQYFIENQGKTLEEIATEMDLLLDSIRLSILIPDEENYEYVIIDPFKNGVTPFGGLLSMRDKDYYDSAYINGYYYENVYGEVNDRNLIVYDEPSLVDIPRVGVGSAFNAGHQKNVYLYNKEKSFENGFVIENEHSFEMNDLQGPDPKFKIPLFKNKARKIVLSIYLEGWDRDNVNNTMGANFIANIAFKVAREMA